MSCGRRSLAQCLSTAHPEQYLSNILTILEHCPLGTAQWAVPSAHPEEKLVFLDSWYCCHRQVKIARYSKIGSAKGWRSGNLSMRLKQGCYDGDCFLSTVGSLQSQPEEIIHHTSKKAEKLAETTFQLRKIDEKISRKYQIVFGIWQIHNVPNTKNSIPNTWEGPFRAAWDGGLADRSTDSTRPHSQSPPLPVTRSIPVYESIRYER